MSEVAKTSILKLGLPTPLQLLSRLVTGLARRRYRGSDLVLGRDGPVLIRNYDFSLNAVTDRFESTSWLGNEVISKAQRPWGGCLDGMNSAGLVASMTFGGSPSHGEGFAIILMLRYVLETCSSVKEAVAALIRIPIAQSQNVTLIDCSGEHASLFLGPDRAPRVTRELLCTNQQEQVISPAYALRSQTVERHAELVGCLADSNMTLERLIERFFVSPLFSRRSGFPTVYTAVYRPAERRVDYLWHGKTVGQRIGAYEPGEYTHDYGELSL